MKKLITIVMIFMLMGCSFKKHSVKVGAAAGAATGIGYGVIVSGVALSDGGDSRAVVPILLGTIILGLFGLGVGATVGSMMEEDKKILHNNDINNMLKSDSISSMKR